MPPWAEPFHRGTLDAPFRAEIENGTQNPFYRIYCGPDGEGKSVAISQALAGLPGIIDVDLEYCSPEEIGRQFSYALDIFEPFTAPGFVVPLCLHLKY